MLSEHIIAVETYTEIHVVSKIEFCIEGVVVPPLKRDMHSNHNFMFPQLPGCKLNIAVIADMAANGQFEFAFNIFKADEEEDTLEMTRLIVYNGLLRFSGALDVLVNKGSDVFFIGHRLYLGLRMSGLIPAGYWLLKVRTVYSIHARDANLLM